MVFPLPHKILSQPWKSNLEKSSEASFPNDTTVDPPTSVEDDGLVERVFASSASRGLQSVSLLGIHIREIDLGLVHMESHKQELVCRS